MPSAKPLLPLDPPQSWTKPTSANTNGGKTYAPTHSDLFRVEFSSSTSSDSSDEETYSSRLVAVKDIEPDSVITNIANASLAPEKAYSSVQFGTGPRDHFELNSDLLFMNHSCSPTAYVDLSSKLPEQWCVRTTPAGLKAGEAITFFYPSTEWDMAQGFDCACGYDNCLKKIQGARYISLEDLESRGMVNPHIRELKEQQ